MVIHFINDDVIITRIRYRFKTLVDTNQRQQFVQLITFKDDSGIIFKF